MRQPKLHRGRWRLMVPGELKSGKNRRRLIRAGNLPRSILSKEAAIYSESFRAYAKPLPEDKLLTSPLRLWVRIYYSSRRPDLEESLLFDLLEGVIYRNDRQVWDKHVSKWFDTEHPRVEIEAEELSEEEISAREQELKARRRVSNDLRRRPTGPSPPSQRA